MPKSPSHDEGFGKLLGMEMYERGDWIQQGPGDGAPWVVEPAWHTARRRYVFARRQRHGQRRLQQDVAEESCATIEIKMVYIAAVREGTLECETRVINKGRRVAVLESEVRNGDRLVAKALGTFAIFPISGTLAPGA